MSADDVLDPGLESDLDTELDALLETSAASRRDRVIEAVVLAVLAVVATYVGTSELLRALQDGHLSPAPVVFPVVVLVTGWLAWRRTLTP